MKFKKIGARLLTDDNLFKIAYRHGGNTALASNIEMMRRLKNSMKFSSWIIIFFTIILIILTIVLIVK